MTQRKLDSDLRTHSVRQILASPISRLSAYLALGKVFVFLPFVLKAYPANLQTFATKWDSNYYQIIATQGYGANAPLAFSPVFPALIKFAFVFIGNSWVSALLVTNLLSFVFPVLLYKAFDYRTALLAELFPTYVVFTTIPYSDVVALIFLAGCFLLLARKEIIASSAALSGAITTFFNLGLTLPIFLIVALRKPHFRNILFYAVPIATGGLLLVWFKIEAGNYFVSYGLESPWGLKIVDPITQASYLLCQNHSSFTCEAWEAQGVFLKPVYWLVRNIVFEAFYLFGALYLLRMKLENKFLYLAFSLSVILPLFCIIGFAVMSIPRLLLPAFPVFLSYATIIKKERYISIYTVACFALISTISVLQYYAFFS